MRSLILVARLTFREAVRNRWIGFFSAAFAALAFLLSLAGSGETASVSSFDRSSAMLLNILLLFIPLLGMTLGAQLVAGDRENGSLVYLLSQPLSKRQLFLGKALGAYAALVASVSVGFAIAGLAIAVGGGAHIGGFLALWFLSLLLIVVCVGIGMLLSTVSRGRAAAIGAAVMAWLSFTVLSDLGLMGTAYVLRLRSEGIVGMALLNPVESFKILAVRVLAADLESLGAGGMYLDYLAGTALPVYLSIWLVVVALATFGIAYGVFREQEET